MCSLWSLESRCPSSSGRVLLHPGPAPPETWGSVRNAQGEVEIAYNNILNERSSVTLFFGL